MARKPSATPLQKSQVLESNSAMFKMRHILLIAVALFTSCGKLPPQNVGTPKANTYEDLTVVSAMKEVMWKGKLGSALNLDTISDKKHLYGVGPTSYLTGELLILDGVAYKSRVTSDSTMQVLKTFRSTAPFFVYTRVKEWQELALPEQVQNIDTLQAFIDQQAKQFKRPFAFKLVGNVQRATIHVQNLALGSKVTSPADAHAGQVNFEIENQDVTVVGFFSTEHGGVFTHHDSFLHMHLITSTGDKMGHVDAITPGSMRLYLPKS